MKKIAVAGLLTAMMSVATAQVYVGGVVGQARVNLDCTDYPQCDKSDTGQKLYVGYKFNPMLALEAAYVDFGKGARGYTFSGYRVSETVEGQGALVAAAFRYAAHPQLSLVGRVGAAFLKSKWSQTVSTFGEFESESDNSVKPYLGLGIEFSLNKNLRLTAEADFTRAELDDDTHAVRMLGVGLQYVF
jgi:OOP family OmpA-OmpF porin